MPERPHPGRYHGDEYVHLPADDKDSASAVLRGLFDERSGRGWKFVSALKAPSDDALLLQWDALASFSD